MNGAESLVRTLIAGGVEVCFANPGTSEMHLLAALDRVPGIRSVLGLFEGVVTGAADGYARMAGRPAVTLLHLGPGLANGLANLHNARRARSPVVNIVGEHATAHQGLASPLETDLEAVARPFSDWVRSAHARRGRPGRGRGDRGGAERARPDRDLDRAGRRRLERGRRAGQHAAGAGAGAGTGGPDRGDRRAAALGRAPPAVHDRGGAERGGARGGRADRRETGAVPLAQMSNARLERGAGRVPIDRLRYPVDQALDQLARLPACRPGRDARAGRVLRLSGQAQPARAGGCCDPRLAGPEDDLVGALAELAERLGAPRQGAPVAGLEPPARPSGALTGDKIALALAAVLPDDAIVADESARSGAISSR